MLITNEQETHFDQLKSLFAKADKVIIASPFLVEESQMISLLHDLNTSKTVKEITIVTVYEGFKQKIMQPKRLLAFVKYCKNNNVRWNVVFHEEASYELHGKVYIFFLHDEPQAFLITSANFTKTGLTKNHEYGVLTDCRNDPREAKVLERLLIGNRPFVIEQQLQVMFDLVKNEPEPSQPEPAPQVNFDSVLKQEVCNKDKCFIKPNGSAKEYVHLSDIDWVSDGHQYFSSKSNSLGAGFICISYGVTANHNLHPILGLFQLTTGLFIDDSKNQRWPHYKESLNLIPEYSKKISATQNALSLEKCAEDFHMLYPTTNIKHDEPRLQQLGTRCDHGNVTAAFARYIESRMRVFANARCTK